MDKSLKCLYRLFGLRKSYYDIWGNKHQLSEEVAREFFFSLGLSRNDLANPGAAVERLRDSQWETLLPAVEIIDEDSINSRLILNIREELIHAKLRWSLQDEGGSISSGELELTTLKKLRSRHVGSTIIHRFIFRLNGKLPLGYHKFFITKLSNSGEETLGVTQLIVTPKQCYLPEVVEREQKLKGLSVQLYAARSKTNWGIGDYKDLQSLIEDVCKTEVSFVGLNPLHAFSLTPPVYFSPYAPLSRSQFNPYYLNVEALEEMSLENSRLCQLCQSNEFKSQIEKTRSSELIDYEGVYDLKRRALEAAFEDFFENHFSKATKRSKEFLAFANSGGDALDKYSTYEALKRHFYKLDNASWGWPVWPLPYQDPNSTEVARFKEENQKSMLFFKYVQWQCNVQLSAVQEKADGLALGLYLDLALGTSKDSADVWATQSSYAVEVEAGAPPDYYNALGQKWGFAPFNPAGLKGNAFKEFIEVLVANMRYASAIRIDHIMSLTRLFWIPEGKLPIEGGYVRYPLKELSAIIALESHRNKCMVIGEDLGTVPNDIRKTMHERRMLSYKVLLFTKDRHGNFLPSDGYPELSLATGTVHDLPSFWSYWDQKDIDIRQTLKLYPRADWIGQMRHERYWDKLKLIERLMQEDLLPRDTDARRLAEAPLSDEVFVAAQRFIEKSSSLLMAIPLEDLFKQLELVNLPGVIDTYPCWKSKLPANIENIRQLELFEVLFRKKTNSPNA